MLSANTSSTNEVAVGGPRARPVEFRVTAPDNISAWAGPCNLATGQHWVKPTDSPDPVWWMNMNYAETIYGSVADVNGLLAGFMVLVVDAAGNGVSRVYTEAAGNYRIGMLAPDQTVTVQFMKDGHRTTKHPGPITLEWQDAVGRQYDLGRTTMTKS